MFKIRSRRPGLSQARPHTNISSDDLIMNRVGAGIPPSSREGLQRLLSANRAIVGELSLPTVLRMVVDAAAEIARARLVALAVIGPDGSLEHFVHTGMDESTVSAIGQLPQSCGLMDAITHTERPIRLSKVDDDERFQGFPPGHLPMGTFLGVPIRSRSEVFGSLYLAERQGGDFTDEDEDLVLALAATAGIAIENARLYEESWRREQWLQAAAQLSTILLEGGGDKHPLQLIVDSVKRLADADVVTLVLPADEPDLLRVAVASGDGQVQLHGMRYADSHSLVKLAMLTGRGMRMGSLDEEHAMTVHLDQDFLDIGPVMAVPLSGKSAAQGAIVAGRRTGRLAFTTADLNLAEAFAIHAALAREVAEARGDQQRIAVLEDRDRIARDLHDHVIQRLFAAGLSLQGMASPDPDPRLSRIVQEIDDTISQIRTTIFDLQVVDLSDSGVRSSVLAIVKQITSSLGFEPTVRFDGPLDTLIDGLLMVEVEAVVRESLTNIAKHALASHASVELTAVDGLLKLLVSDDGVGLSQSTRRSGLRNMQRRAEDLGGTLTIASNTGAGTQLQWTVPIPDEQPPQAAKFDEGAPELEVIGHTSLTTDILVLSDAETAKDLLIVTADVDTPAVHDCTEGLTGGA